jgi:predicted metal-dependent peptidase
LANNFNAPLPETFELEPGKYYEEYYRQLLDDLEDMMKTAIKMYGEPKDGQGEGQPQDGDGEGEGGFQEFKDGNQALKEYQNPFSTANQDWAENDLFDAEVNNMIDEKKSSMKNWGKFTGNSMGEIVAANSPKISWKDIVRRFKNSIMTTKQTFTRMKVNRRYDLASPGKRRLYKSKLIFAVDCSGSMDDDDLQEGFAVINSVCKHAEIEYILFDTEIKIIEKKIKNARKKFKVSGRGGTDFNDIMRYAEKSNADGMVVFTDGYAPVPYKPKNTKILWLLTKKEYNRPSGCDWGIVGHLDRWERR